MCSYNRLNGPQTCESPALLSDLKASGFDGFVVPDFIFAVKDPLAATLAGARRPRARRRRAGARPPMFTSGQVPAARLDDIVRRTLFAMFDSGAFDDPLGPAAAERQHARAPGAGDAGVGEAAWCCCKNDRHALPLGGARAALDRRDRPLGRRRGLHQRRLVGRAAGARRAPSRRWPGSARAPGPAVNVTAAQGSLGDVPLTTIVPRRRAGGSAGLHVLEQRRLRGRARADARRPDRRPGRGARGRRAAVVGALDGHASRRPSRACIASRCCRRGWRRCGSTASASARLPRGRPVPRRPALPDAGRRAPHGRQAGRRSASTTRARRSSSARRSTSRGSRRRPRASRRRSRRRATPTPRSSSPTTRRARAWTASTLALPGDQDAAHRRRGRGQPQDDRRAQHRRPGADAVAAPRRGACSRPGTRASSSAPRSPRCCSATAIPAAGCRSPSRPATTQGPAPPTRPERYPGVNGEQRYDEGIFVGYRWYDQFRQQPLFPFGYGLSYARLPLRRPARAAPITAA